MRTLGDKSLAGVFTKSPEMMADLLSSKELATGGPAEGLRLLTVYIAYAGKRLSISRKQSLERARELLLKRMRQSLTNKQNQLRSSS
ncbi:MAG: hypothetical protein ABR907_05325 [Terracidiphilus sp.]|jgi:hypothetical protein